jgi:hypothetical protein
MLNRSSGFISTSISKEQARDSGMAIVLILLIIGYFANEDIYYKAAIPVLLMNMIFPRFYYPFAVLWFSLSNLLGTIVSKILLSVVFFIVVMPIALLRRLLGKDTLLLKKFKGGNGSVMKTRNHTFMAADLEKPF